ncbi:MAG: CHAT domain-containing protein [Cyanobacteria bacterium J06626_4]
MNQWLRLLLSCWLGLGLSLGWGYLAAGGGYPAFAQASPIAFVQAGQAAYDAQQFTEANEQLQQAVAGFATAGDRPQQAQALALQSLVLQKLGQWDAAQATLDESWAILDALAEAPSRLVAQVLNTQGQLYLATGQSVDALTTWEQAEAAYREADDLASALGSQINQVQAMQAIGLYRRAGQTLEAIAQQFDTQAPSPIKAKGLLSFGNLLRLRGEFTDARTLLSEGLALATSLNLPEDVAQFHLSLGNTERVAAARATALGDRATATTARQAALSAYAAAADSAVSPFTQVQATLNQLSLLVDEQRWDDAQRLIPAIANALPTLLPSRAGVYAQVNFAHTLIVFSQSQPVAPELDISVPKLLSTAIAQAQQIEDERAIAYAIGTLGTWHEQQADWATAKSLTAEALQTAQKIRAPDIAYQWQWQLGRLFQAAADAQYQTAGGTSSSALYSPADPEAIRYYSVTVETLDNLRSELVALNPDVQFSFRETVEPIYRQLVDLLLRAETPTANALDQAREVIESLQLAELDNFFQDACLVATPVELDQVDANALVIYPIMLPDRLEIITSMPGRSLRHTMVPINTAQLNRTLDTLRAAISFPNAVNRAATARGIGVVIGEARDEAAPQDYLPLAQQLYDWLIRPLEAQLQQVNPEALVFVLDGTLRNLPMSVLNDGEEFLVEKYAIALTPGLQLIEPRPLAEQDLQALVVGLSEARDGFSALPNVETEVAAIQMQVPGEVLLNEGFEKAEFATQLTESSFPIVHMATHGQFSSDPEQTFILAWDDRIQAAEFGSLLQQGERQRDNAVELLVLSACETAAGDDRAALGLAGVAVRSGARSTLATLWLVDDAGTSVLMADLYQQLQDTTLTKAAALRQAQLQLLSNEQYQHPFFWAPFVLIGNWL